MRAISTWLQAARPLAQMNIALPILFGTALAWAWSGAVNVGWLLGALGLGIVAQLVIVFANDVADEAGDRGNELFNFASGGSRVLVEGKLERSTLLRAAIAASVVLLLSCVAVGLVFGRPFLIVFAIATIGLTWAYSFPPLSFAYRGLGEPLQGIGCGIVLPLLGWTMQLGGLEGFPWQALVPAFVLGVASNITTALPDAPADAAVDKQTWPVRYGPRRARKHSLQLVAIGTLATPLVLPGLSHAGLVAIQVLPALALLFNLRGSRSADAEHRRACRRFVFVNGLAIALVFVGWIAALIIAPTALIASP